MGREQQRCRGDGLHRPVSQVIGLNDSLTGPAQTLPRRHTSITVTPHTHTTPPLSTALPHGSRSSRDVRGHTSIHPPTDRAHNIRSRTSTSNGKQQPSNHYTTIKTMMNQHYNNYNSHGDPLGGVAPRVSKVVVALLRLFAQCRPPSHTPPVKKLNTTGPTPAWASRSPRRGAPRTSHT